MIAAVALAAALASTSQFRGTLSGGGAYVVQRDTAQPTAAIELWYRVPSAGYDNAAPGIARLAIAALAASAPAHGTSLAEMVRNAGGSLTINVYPDIAMVGVSVVPSRAPAIVRALSAAYFAPSISDAGFKAAQRDSAIVAAENAFDSEHLLQDALFSHLFSTGPAHYSPVPADAAAFAKISLDAARAFAERGLRQQNAYLTMAGDSDPAWISSVRTGIAQGAATADPPFDSTLSGKSIDVTQPAQVAGLGFAWAGPPIADHRAATAMDFIADYLFDSDYGTVSRAISAAHPDAYASGQFITLHDPGVLIATISGASAAATRAQVLAAVSSMLQPMDGARFSAARNAFVYHILSQAQTPAGYADNLGWYGVEGDAGYAPGDASGTYLDTAQSLDAAYVAQIAAKYLRTPAIVQLLSSPQNGAAT